MQMSAGGWRFAYLCPCQRATSRPRMLETAAKSLVIAVSCLALVSGDLNKGISGLVMF